MLVLFSGEGSKRTYVNTHCHESLNEERSEALEFMVSYGRSEAERVLYVEDDLDLNYETDQRHPVNRTATYNQTPDAGVST